jgi:hypothetical protein
MTFRIGACLSAVLLFGTTASCRYSEPPKEPEASSPSSESRPTTTESSDSSSESSESEPAEGESPTPPTQTTGACDDRACTATEDCCKGYACGFDPERSRVQRFCLPQ